MIRKTLLAWIVLAMISRLAAAPGKTLSLDILLDTPTNWSLTPDSFEKHFDAEGKGLFKWLTKEHTRAKLSRHLYSNIQINMTLFQENIPVEEAVVDFVDGKLNMVTFSIFNRGDDAIITPDDFKNRYLVTGKAMSTRLNTRTVPRTANRQQGLLTEGFSWDSPMGTALMETNEGGSKGTDVEFLRLRIARPNAVGALAASMRDSRAGSAISLSKLPGNLTKDNDGNVFIHNIPMVDQGNKGYCLPAAIQRVFEYYGINADMHQIAQVAGSDPTKGTSALSMSKELSKIDYRFKTRLMIFGLASGPEKLTKVEIKKGNYYIGKPVDQEKFLKDIRTMIDKGVPLLWALELGKYPEEPNLKLQGIGGHMRLIIGYNDKTDKLIFTDTWGEGHEFKTMKQEHAYAATQGLFALKPTQD